MRPREVPVGVGRAVVCSKAGRSVGKMEVADWCKRVTSLADWSRICCRVVAESTYNCSTMLQFCITTTPSGRVIVSMFLPEDAVEGSQLGALIADLGCLIQLGLPEAAVAECKQCDFVSAKVGPESSKYAGTRGVADVTTEVAALTAYRAHRRAQLLLGVHEEGRRIFPYEGRV
jgi:hypothetical protein